MTATTTERVSTLPVSEVFGPVWQGEGPHAGRRCSFLRLGMCNLSCEWCDTPYTWDRTRFDLAEECPQRDATWVLKRLARQGTRHLVLSGGEPLIHSHNPALLAVLAQWIRLGLTFDVETNGTLGPPTWADTAALFCVSPKLWTHDPEKRRIRPAVLAAWEARDNRVWKIVCQTPAQVAEVADWPWVGRRDRVWIMPEGRSAAEVLARARDIEQAVADHGFQFTLRQHTLLHDDERGH